MSDKPLPRISIIYCTRCGWLLRAAWLAQELLTTFTENVREVALVPDSKTGGILKIFVEDTCVWDQKVDGSPQIVPIKQHVRDIVAPEKSLGHADRKKENV
eukprot:TRINITY_DN11520_c0_g1_i1.p1 TRINITY_DN11520_c0_g1~~TRINITY_DN11520_c0_g1_i1.p1  ORF type:complete len:101 (-),score=13.75 TRINITY_DN11520_c0_g1_i1:3-305(-)